MKTKTAVSQTKRLALACLSILVLVLFNFSLATTVMAEEAPAEETQQIQTQAGSGEEQPPPAPASSSEEAQPAESASGSTTETESGSEAESGTESASQPGSSGESGENASSSSSREAPPQGGKALRAPSAALTTRDEIQQAITNGTSPITITISGAIPVDAVINIPAGKTVTITNAGDASLLRTNNATNFSIFTVEVGATLTLDSIPLNGNATEAAPINAPVIYNSGTLNLTGSTEVTGGYATQSGIGGGIATTGAVNMSGTSSVHENTTASNGGGIFGTGSATLNMSGSSSIWGNAATTYGGGVFISNFTMEDDASLYSNTAGNGGGGAYVTASSAGTCIISGNAHLYKNSVTADTTSNLDGGGALHLRSGVTATINGNVVIGGDTEEDGNSAMSGGGIYSSCSLVISGNVKISYNYAQGSGGGIMFNPYLEELTLQDNVLITNNRAMRGSGIYTQGTAAILNFNGSPRIGVDNKDNSIFFHTTEGMSAIGIHSGLTSSARINVINFGNLFPEEPTLPQVVAIRESGTATVQEANSFFHYVGTGNYEVLPYHLSYMGTEGECYILSPTTTPTPGTKDNPITDTSQFPAWPAPGAVRQGKTAELVPGFDPVTNPYVKVTLSLESKPLTSAQNLEGDIYLLLDASSSMSGAKNVALKKTALDFVEKLLNEPGNSFKIGVIYFGRNNTHEVACGLTDDLDVLRAAISGLPVNHPNTYMATALNEAIAGLDASAASKKCIIALSDGTLHDAIASKTAADAAGAKGIDLFTIGFQTAGTDLKTMVQNSGTYQDAEDSTVLDKVFNNIADAMLMPNTEAVVLDEVPSYFDIVANDPAHPFTVTGVSAGAASATHSQNMLTWQVGTIPQSTTFTYYLRLNDPAQVGNSLQTNVSASVQYKNAQDNYCLLTFPVPSVTITAGTGTPAPTTPPTPATAQPAAPAAASSSTRAVSSRSVSASQSASSSASSSSAVSSAPSSSSSEAPEITVISDPVPPIVNPPAAGWSLINLLIMVVSGVMAIALLISFFAGNREKPKMRAPLKLLAILCAAAALVVGFVTQHFSGPMQILNTYTLLLGVLLVLQIVFLAVGLLTRKNAQRSQ